MKARFTIIAMALLLTAFCQLPAANGQTSAPPVPGAVPGAPGAPAAQPAASVESPAASSGVQSALDAALAALPQAMAFEHAIARTAVERDNGLAMRSWLARLPRLPVPARASLEIDFADAMLEGIEAACRTRSGDTPRLALPSDQTGAMKSMRLLVLAEVENILISVRARAVRHQDIQAQIGERLNKIATLRRLVLAAPIATAGRAGSSPP